jgi:hypothetical protein
MRQITQGFRELPGTHSTPNVATMWAKCGKIGIGRTARP